MHIEDFYDSEHTFNFEENNFKIAVAVLNKSSYALNRNSGEALDSPDYVRWEPITVTKSEGELTESPLKFHKCNDADFEEFYPP